MYTIVISKPNQNKKRKASKISKEKIVYNCLKIYLNIEEKSFINVFLGIPSCFINFFYYLSPTCFEICTFHLSIIYSLIFDMI